MFDHLWRSSFPPAGGSYFLLGPGPLNVTGIFAYMNASFFGFHVGKYTSPI